MANLRLRVWNGTFLLCGSLSFVQWSPSKSCFSKYGLRTSSISITRELVRNANSLALPQTCWIRTYILTRSPGDSWYSIVGEVCSVVSCFVHSILGEFILCTAHIRSLMPENDLLSWVTWWVKDSSSSECRSKTSSAGQHSPVEVKLHPFLTYCVTLSKFLISLGLSFLICKRRLIIMPSLTGCCQD